MSSRKQWYLFLSSTYLSVPEASQHPRTTIASLFQHAELMSHDTADVDPEGDLLRVLKSACTGCRTDSSRSIGSVQRAYRDSYRKLARDSAGTTERSFGKVGDSRHASLMLTKINVHPLIQDIPRCVNEDFLMNVRSPSGDAGQRSERPGQRSRKDRLSKAPSPCAPRRCVRELSRMYSLMNGSPEMILVVR